MGKCGCGRSPTGMCKGWHGLSDEEYQKKLKNIRINRRTSNYVQKLEQDLEIHPSSPRNNVGSLPLKNRIRGVRMG